MSRHAAPTLIRLYDFWPGDDSCNILVDDWEESGEHARFSLPDGDISIGLFNQARNPTVRIIVRDSEPVQWHLASATALRVDAQYSYKLISHRLRLYQSLRSDEWVLEHGAVNRMPLPKPPVNNELVGF